MPFSTGFLSRYRYAGVMAANTHKGSPLPTTHRLQILLNFCRVVVRSDENHLQVAMLEYERSLSNQPAR